jgi:tripeptide aminopeptidase
MKKQFEGKMHIVDIAEQAMKDSGIEPKIKAIRGRDRRCAIIIYGIALP